MFIILSTGWKRVSYCIALEKIIQMGVSLKGTVYFLEKDIWHNILWIYPQLWITYLGCIFKYLYYLGPESCSLTSQHALAN